MDLRSRKARQGVKNYFKFSRSVSVIYFSLLEIQKCTDATRRRLLRPDGVKKIRIGSRSFRKISKFVSL